MARRPLRPSDLEVMEEFKEPAEEDGNLWDAIERVLRKAISTSDKEVMERQTESGTTETENEEGLRSR